jgi:hypothetical protein
MSRLASALPPTGRPALGSRLLPFRSGLYRSGLTYGFLLGLSHRSGLTYRFLLSLSLTFLTTAPSWAASPPRGVSMHPWSLELPGAPAAVIPADLDGDRRMDLVVVVNVSEWTQKEVQDSSQMSQVKGLLDAMTIIPAIDDRREIRVFLARAEGGYRALPPFPLPLSVLGMEAGPPGAPVLALTDEGVSALRLGPGETLRLEPLIADPPVLAGTGNFVTKLGLMHDLDGDGIPDLVLPARDGLAIYMGTPTGLASKPVARLPVPGEAYASAEELRHAYPLPEVADVDGDGRPDLVFQDPEHLWERVWVIRNAGGGRFLPAVEIPLTKDAKDDKNDKSDKSTKKSKAPKGAKGRWAERPVFFGDVDGDGVAELVTSQRVDGEAKGMRAEIRQANEPLNRYRFYHLDRKLEIAAQPYLTLDAKGYAFEGEQLAGGLQDLNGDHRLDFLTVTLDLSIWKAMRVLVTKSLSLTVDFHVWCQDTGGRFHAVPGLDLAGHLRFNINDLKMNQLALFAGDFDGDGRADFVQLGRGKEVSIHLGRPDCSFPTRPDYLLKLREEPKDVALVQVRDLDGDGRADLMVVEPRSPTEPGLAPPVRLDLYLSGGRQ